MFFSCRLGDVKDLISIAEKNGYGFDDNFFICTIGDDGVANIEIAKCENVDDNVYFKLEDDEFRFLESE